MPHLELIPKTPEDPQKSKLREVILQKSYVVRNGAVSESEVDNALQAKRHQRRMEAKQRL
jgi:hypothetical protein